MEEDLDMDAKNRELTDITNEKGEPAISFRSSSRRKKYVNQNGGCCLLQFSTNKRFPVYIQRQEFCCVLIVFDRDYVVKKFFGRCTKKIHSHVKSLMKLDKREVCY